MNPSPDRFFSYKLAQNMRSVCTSRWPASAPHTMTRGVLLAALQRATSQVLIASSRHVLRCARTPPRNIHTICTAQSEK
ncbi:hypothetical protein Y032_0328g2632 [Ancylostoma ceylanicum]|uniref:Uncharacterized protein n=1 Tax=Ancylostoma ceylanicum TaxID=53326 RepID=A0A016S0E1_9BILA|nr:hypothetical protein Y032_0328g2632 [Ancylostoma ceylanicum]